VAFSSTLVGAGVLAGGPYYCANGMIAYALSACMSSPFMISVKELVAYTYYSETNGYIDPVKHLLAHKVWMYSGTKDTVVAPGVMQALQTYYTYFVNASATDSHFTTPSQHAFITNGQGGACGFLGSPYINNCQFDAAGSLLNWIHGPLKQPVSQITSNLVTISQSQFVPSGFTASGICMQNNAYIYLPTKCASAHSGCIVHISMHGCQQTIDDIGNKFYTMTGYNGWAEANGIIILYPQAKDCLLNNPNGCFDWWGYTNSAYATRTGPQMVTVKNMVDYIVKTYVA